MKWLTDKQVMAAANKGHIEAIRCSLRHWNQLLSATKAELRLALKRDNNPIHGELCALCRRYFEGGYDALKSTSTCGLCPLRPHGKSRGCGDSSLWDRANNALGEWEFNKTNPDWRVWQEAAKAMRDYLAKALARAKERAVK